MQDKLAELEAVDVPCTKEDDFDEFWSESLEKVKTVPLNVEGDTIDYPIESMEVRDLTFDGLDGTPIQTWYLLPAEHEKEIPCVICYHGAGGSRQTPASHVQWVAMGYAVIAYDFRLQGGVTGSESGFEIGRVSNGWFALSLGSKEKAYKYHAMTDALRAVELAKSMPEIDDTRIAVHGGSQGGATVLTVAALHDDVSLAMADVPSNSWFEKRLFDEAGGMSGAAQFLKNYPEKVDDALKTLSYFDNINFAEDITCPILVSFGMKDPVCPPPNVYAAYNKIPDGKKHIIGYPFCGHEGGGMVHNEEKLKFIRQYFG